MRCVAQRLIAGVKVDENGCWIWQRALNPTGYGYMGVIGKRMAYTHRVSAELFYGPIPKGMTVDHVCRNPACCNPHHLEIVTPRENNHRGERGPLHSRGLDCGWGRCAICIRRHRQRAEVSAS